MPGRCFYYGETTLHGTALSLVARSLFHRYNVWPQETIPDIVVWLTQTVALWVVPAAMAILAAGLILVCWRWFKKLDLSKLDELDRAYLLIGIILALSLGILVAVHYVTGVLYPIDRTAIYLVVLVTMAWILLTERAWSGRIEAALSERWQPHSRDRHRAVPRWFHDVLLLRMAL